MTLNFLYQGHETLIWNMIELCTLSTYKFGKQNNNNLKDKPI